MDQERGDIYRDGDKARWTRLHFLDPLFDKLDNTRGEAEERLTFIDEDPFHMYFDDENGERLRLRKYHRDRKWIYIKYLFDPEGKLVYYDQLKMNRSKEDAHYVYFELNGQLYKDSIKGF